MVNGTMQTLFTDFMATTPSSFASGIEEFTIFLDTRTWMLNAMMEHSAEGKFYGGKYVEDRFVDNTVRTGRYRRPNGQMTYAMPQHTKSWKSYPTFFLDYVAWTAQELVQHGITKDLRGDVLRQKFKNLREIKFQMQKVGQAEQFEEDIMAAPDHAAMEGPEAYKPRSLFCYVNEGLDPEWTTLQGIDTANTPDFTCEKVLADYSVGKGTSSWAAFQAMDVLLTRTRRERIPYVNRDQNQSQGPPRYEILYSQWGKADWQHHLRVSNDHLRMGAQDAGYSSPQHEGIKGRYISQLDDAAVWPGASSKTGETEKTSVRKGPRYILMDYAAYTPRFHEEYKFLRHEVREHPSVVGTKVMPIETWWMTLSQDPRCLGVLAPSNDNEIPAIFA